MLSPSIRRLLAQVAFIMVLVILLYAGLGPHGVPKVFHDADKVYHVAGFAALVVTMRLAFPRGDWWWQVVAALGLGAGIELVQVLEPDRIASIWDFVVDALGVALGWLSLRLPVLRDWRVI